MVNISVIFVYVLIIGVLGFVFWRIRKSPITDINQAVIDNDIETVKECLGKGIDGDSLVTSLCSAAEHGHQEIAELLLDYGADINHGLEEEYGINPLLNAAINGHKKLVKMLIARGAKIGLHFAALQGNIDVVRNYPYLEAKMNSIRNLGMTPLHCAALGNQREIAEIFLDLGADINFNTQACETPLHQAVNGKSTQVIELLIERGADINIIGLIITPLQLAIKNDDLKIAELLIAKGADVNAISHDLISPLHILARNKNAKVKLAELLIANGADVNACADKNWGTPLHFAALNDNLAVARVLLRHGANVDSKKSDGETALHCVAWHGNLDFARLLIGYGADVNSKTSPLGYTPLGKAQGYPAMTKLLLANGATDYGWGD